MMMMMLTLTTMSIAWAGSVLISLSLPAPKYCETIEEMALLTCAKTQISMDKKEPTMATAPRLSLA